METLKKVDYVNADMSPVMKDICNKTMPQAQIVIDKFHVIKHIYNALQSIRLDVKKKVKESTEINRNNPNNWTDIELIEKTKYLLYKPESSLEKEQLTLLDALLTQYPTIQIAYQLVQQFASWYHKRNIGKPLYIIKSELEKWKENVRRVKLKAITHVMNMVERHQEDILRYFEKGLTNAKAENLNARIQRFIMVSLLTIMA